MLDWRLASAHVILAVTLTLWCSGKVLSVDVATETFDTGIRDMQSPPTVREEKSTADLAAKLMLLDELVSLENDVIETKKKRSFSGFGSPLDRLSAGSVQHRGKQSSDLVLMKQHQMSSTYVLNTVRSSGGKEEEDAVSVPQSSPMLTGTKNIYNTETQSKKRYVERAMYKDHHESSKDKWRKYCAS